MTVEIDFGFGRQLELPLRTRLSWFDATALMKDRKIETAMLHSHDQSNSTIATVGDVRQADAICYRRDGSGQLRIATMSPFICCTSSRRDAAQPGLEALLSRLEGVVV
ncbi:hypothetical protein HJB90_01590 [Rhizobium sp. NLR10a]|uniref:hypothetical protein n=1 Tax=unclassified Rhizobium TaxID=2613769 RepID=UPI001C838955|nr:MULTISPECIES: hypothetical protein [unclassified Rhizobium]MBX5214381.1 hypothetical protein [Rhizobium sp. NLR9a]MBX5273694.1 hypothetical protein [Rhizobium sp. NLR13a]MBX5279756.1 hypothetical protein [Rhizobium sp. NLR10a]MBX5291670.1 hypothetical protein [Rhizobium sp. NLR15a]